MATLELGDELDSRLDAFFAADPTVLADPFPVFEELRRRATVYAYRGSVLVSGYEDARAVIRDDNLCWSKAESDAVLDPEIEARLDEGQLEAYREMAGFTSMFVSRTDPPEHDRLRAIAHRAFTPRRIAALKERIQRYADELIDDHLAGLDRRETVDLMPFAYRLPLMVIVDMLGVPQSDRELIHGWSSDYGRSFGRPDTPTLLRGCAAIRSFREYVDGMLAGREHGPALTDLVAALIDAGQDDRLSAEELAAMFVVLLFAGHETTTNLISIGLSELLRSGEWGILCGDPGGRAAAATEELLRWTSPVQFIRRKAKVAVELTGGRVEPGQNATLMLAAANRDPSVFPNANRLDISRRESRAHIAFGFGPHFCLGASLARYEGEIAFASLARRFPRLELAEPAVSFHGSAILRTPVAVRLRLSA